MVDLARGMGAEGGAISLALKSTARRAQIDVLQAQGRTLKMRSSGRSRTVLLFWGRNAALTIVLLAILVAMLAAVPQAAMANDGEPIAQASGLSSQSVQVMHRLYNPYSGEHFYTASAGEKNYLVSVGWRYEGEGWKAPLSGADVYRMYNPFAGDHHYTTSASERDSLVRAGWNNEGVGWKSGGSVPLYRQYNPYAKVGTHNYTTSKAENDNLVRAGWSAEGIGWYGAAAGSDAENTESMGLGGWWQSIGEVGTRWAHVVGRSVYVYRYSYPGFSGLDFLTTRKEFCYSTTFTLTRFEAGSSSISESGGYQLRCSNGSSYLHFDDSKDTLWCSELDLRGYSASSSYTRAEELPQGLADFASTYE